ncbi:general amidase protein [Rutstroemia sp. NJR-2017a BBW]|nr:general amidase protein [Rutstroemia sp. NJR-2017a BBW]
MYADGHHDIQKQLALSGEPILDDLKGAYKLKEPIPVLEYQDLALQIRDYKEAYADYWDSTAGTDGKVVDAVLMPAAPHAAVIPGKWVHLAYTEVINVLDYTSLVIPVTHANKEIDIRPPYGNISSRFTDDREAYHGAPVGIQIVGRLWEEEKIIEIGKYVEMLLNDGNSLNDL